MSKITIALICGTARPGNQTIKAARFVEAIGKKLNDVDLIFVDIKDHSMKYDGRNPEDVDPDYASIVEKADAFFIVMPEYNHSYPGSLKRLLDSRLQPYEHKAVAVAGVSSGHFGGARGVENLLPCLRELKLVVVEPNVYFSTIQDLFTDNGVIVPDQEERFTKSVEDVYAELIWMAKALKNARENGV